MARRIFRRSRKFINKTSLLSSYNSGSGNGVYGLEWGSMEQLCSGLSEEHVESLSTFLVEANMFQAKSSDESVSVTEAQRFLKATRFNSSKAVEIFKNYHKHRDSYQLDNLRPHRNPLSSEIGSKKLEIVGTCDSEGSPIVVFTVARHDMKSSDYKAAMQLLFYTLDQLAESDPENGVVIIMDMRDITITSFDVRYVTNILSVFRDGYPLFIKAIYIVSPPIWVRTHVAVSKAFKQDTNKVHFVSVSELSTKYFQSSQLPHSLGGSYVPGTPTQRTTQNIKQPPATPSRLQQHHHNGETGTTASSGVNTLVQAFQGGSTTTSTGGRGVGGSGPGPARPPPPSPHAKPKPLPPTRTKSSPMPPPKSRSRENSNSSQPPAVFKKPPPHSNSPHGNGDVSQRGEATKAKLPMLPRSGGASKGSASPSPQNKYTAGFSGKLGSPTRVGGIKGHSTDKSSEVAGGGGIASRIQKLQEKTLSEDWHGATASSSRGNIGDERTRSGSAGSQTTISPNHSKQGSPNKAAKKPLIPVKLLSSEREKDKEKEREKERRGKESASNDRQTRGSISAGMKGERERISSRVPPPHNPHTHTSHMHDESHYASLSVSTSLTNHSTDVTDGGEYENVEIQPMPEVTGGHGHQQAPPHQPIAYENISLKPSPKAHHGHAQQKPRPHQQQSSTSRQQSSTSKQLVHQGSVDNYENVEFSPLPSQSSQRHGPAPSMPAPVPHPSPSEEHVMDDDDTLFGKEGPPGMKREEVIYENFGPDDGNKYMTMEEMERHIRKKDKKGLSAEYLRIKNEPLCGNYKACRLRCNLPKNRYKDVVCYDETRVVLKALPGVEGSDYIHANYVNGYNKPQAFILTQGPKDKTVNDFWRLVWEKNVRVIVMITKCVELGKRKCSQYWPETCDPEGVSHGNVTIQLVKTVSVTSEGYDVHTLKVSSMGAERVIMHYQFLAWPDYGVPLSGHHVLQLLFSVRKAQSRQAQLVHPPHGPPILVHCSAGVGRSGAFCTLDICIDELKDKNRVNLQGVVRRMRMERAYSVQTDEQYEFCYRTVLEYAKGCVS